VPGTSAFFKSSPGGSDVQPQLRTDDIGDVRLKEAPEGHCGEVFSECNYLGMPIQSDPGMSLSENKPKGRHGKVLCSYCIKEPICVVALFSKGSHPGSLHSKGFL
jgi:hypothetical protein